jgi:hypothetical protein
MQALQAVKQDGTKGQIYFSAAARYQALDLMREDTSIKWVEILAANTHEIVDRVYRTKALCS